MFIRFMNVAFENYGDSVSEINYLKSVLNSIDI